MTDIESLSRKEGDRILIGITLSPSCSSSTRLTRPRSMKKSWTLPRNITLLILSRIFRQRPGSGSSFISRLKSQAPKKALRIPQAIHNHFEYKVMVQDRKFRQRFRHGRFTLLIGLSFLAIALFARQAVSHINNLLYAQIFSDALLIIGWAAMGEPVVVLLYELWPIIELKRTCEKISKTEIDILPRL